MSPLYFLTQSADSSEILPVLIPFLTHDAGCEAVKLPRQSAASSAHQTSSVVLYLAPLAVCHAAPKNHSLFKQTSVTDASCLLMSTQGW